MSVNLGELWSASYSLNFSMYQFQSTVFSRENNYNNSTADWASVTTEERSVGLSRTSEEVRLESDCRGASKGVGEEGGHRQPLPTINILAW